MTAPNHNPCVGDWEAIRPVECACRIVVDGRRAARALADWARRFELSEPEFQVLWSLRNVTHQGVDQTTLSQQLALSPAQMSATVERLGARGWITQHVRPDDRRRRLWRLSAVGRATLIAMLRDAGSLRFGPDGREVAA